MDAQAQEALVVEHLPLSRRLAAALYKRREVQAIGELADVQQIAAIGLMDAARRYDPAVGVRFSTFASCRVRGTILDAARQAGLVRVPRLAIAQGERLYVVQEQRIGSNDGDDRDTWQFDHVPEQRAASLRRLADVDAADDVRRLLMGLSARERRMIVSYLGLFGQRPQPMREVAAELGISESRVSQTYSALMRHLHRRSANGWL